MKLLFAINFGFKLAATYVDEAGETQTKDLPVTELSGALANLITTELKDPIRSYQIASEHAEAETGAVRIEVVMQDGTLRTLLADGDMQAANTALRAEIERAL